jgi:hypothetical protein
MCVQCIQQHVRRAYVYAGQPWVCGTVVWHAGQPFADEGHCTCYAAAASAAGSSNAGVLLGGARQKEQPERNKGRVRGRLTTGRVLPVRWIWCGSFVLKEFWEKAPCMFFFHCQLWHTCGRPLLHSRTHTHACVQ